MQITIDLPETLGEKLRLFPNLNDFIIKLLSQNLLLLSHNAGSRRGERVWTRDEPKSIDVGWIKRSVST